ncbi:response regulator [Rhizohabitans arisaemae]|uniref:response regulator n=1 Tax=Rhizohabitans arisaemae TaxID=2720610 RepID=UPI0024B1DC7D|nr:response regulator [Rhizohabitans arisaemae]
MITVSLVDDDQMLIDGLTAWLARVPDIELIAAARTVGELLSGGRKPAQVVVLDLLLADCSDPVENVTRLTAAGSRVLVVGVASSGDLAGRVVQAGARGYLTKDHSLTTLTDAVRAIAAEAAGPSPEPAHRRHYDRPALSPQERAVLLAYASGMTLTAAARRAGIKPGTAKNYLDRVKEKYRKAGRPAYTKLDLATLLREDDLRDR